MTLFERAFSDGEQAMTDNLEYPTVPAYIMACIQAYGDARADDDGTSGERIEKLVRELRGWADDVRCAERITNVNAKRYRWLRDPSRIPRGEGDGHLIVADGGGEDVLWTEQLDAAIDSRMGGES